METRLDRDGDELRRMLAAETDHLESEKRTAADHISHLNTVHTQICSRLDRKLTQLQRIRSLADSELRQQLDADIRLLRAKKQSTAGAISHESAVYTQIQAKLALRRTQLRRLEILVG